MHSRDLGVRHLGFLASATYQLSDIGHVVCALNLTPLLFPLSVAHTPEA